MTPYQKNLKKADHAFAVYIKSRDCMRTTETRTHGTCFTCGEYFHISELQCGHFVTRSCKVLRFDKKNAHIQCVNCNQFLSGNMEVYHERMSKMYGEKTKERLWQKRWAAGKTYNAKSLLAVAKQYNELTGKLSLYSHLKPFPKHDKDNTI